MRITSVHIEKRKIQENCGEHCTKTHRYYTGVATVDWGYECMACPDDNGNDDLLSCQSTVDTNCSEFICTKHCSADDHDRALPLVQDSRHDTVLHQR